MDGQEDNDRRGYCAACHWILHKVCDDDSATGGPSQRFRDLGHDRKVQQRECRSLCISSAGWNNSSRRPRAIRRIDSVFQATKEGKS
jgi:hypothetical protein